MTQSIDRTGETRDRALVETTSGDAAFSPAIAARLEGAIGAARRDPPPPPPGAPHPPETPSPAPASGLSAQEWPGKSPAAPAGPQTARTGTVEARDGAGAVAAERGAGRGSEADLVTLQRADLENALCLAAAAGTAAPIDALLAKRGKTHGPWGAQAALAQQLKALAQAAPSWAAMSPALREALEMDLVKTSRILTGNPYEPDHWDDKAGYATLAAKEIRRAQGFTRE